MGQYVLRLNAPLPTAKGRLEHRIMRARVLKLLKTAKATPDGPGTELDDGREVFAFTTRPIPKPKTKKLRRWRPPKPATIAEIKRRAYQAKLVLLERLIAQDDAARFQCRNEDTVLRRLSAGWDDACASWNAAHEVPFVDPITPAERIDGLAAALAIGLTYNPEIAPFTWEREQESA